MPTLSAEVVKLALPDASSVLLPSLAPPSLNVTKPDGVPPPDELTLALKVTGWRNVEGFSVELSVTAVGSFTPCEIDILLVPQLESPE
jgi:hypothetical protein